MAGIAVRAAIAPVVTDRRLRADGFVVGDLLVIGNLLALVSVASRGGQEVRPFLAAARMMEPELKEPVLTGSSLKACDQSNRRNSGYAQSSGSDCTAHHELASIDLVH
jgi:hypothetical protein